MLSPRSLTFFFAAIEVVSQRIRVNNKSQVIKDTFFTAEHQKLRSRG